MNIKVISSHYGFLEQKDIVIGNLTEYCNKHGYDLILNYIDNPVSDMTAYWKKIEVIKNNLNDCDYLLWLDTDTYIYNLSKTVESLLDPNFDFDLLLTCENCIQTGAYLFKNSEWSHAFINRMIAFGEEHNINGINYCDDTLALIYILDEERNMIHGGDKIVSTYEDDIAFLNTIESERINGKSGDLLSHIKLISNREFMVKHVHVYQLNTSPFIIHIPGSTKEDKYKFMKYYSDNKHLDWRNFNI